MVVGYYNLQLFVDLNAQHKRRSLDKRWRIPKGQSNKDNPEKLAL